LSQKSLHQQIREAAENDLEAFIRLVDPQRVLGHVHRELISWWNREDAKSHQLVLLPRDHGKSSLIAYRVAWILTKHPTYRILYISATSKLATKQLGLIKQILTSPNYAFYWPEMVNSDEAKRTKWTETEIEIELDHPLRRSEFIRDPSVFVAGLTTKIAGMHCDIAVLDDVVIEENAYDEAQREKVSTQISYLASITGTEARIWVVGTRYHPKDLYNNLVETIVPIVNDLGEQIDSYNLYEIFERQVETRGDGTGQFLWPRQQRYDGKWFGFNTQILAQKKAQYANVTKFRAQYYNNPNDFSTSTVTPDMFQYYDKKHLDNIGGYWTFKGRRLNVFAGIDLAFSVSTRADFSCITVIGIDAENNFYVLDVDRFKTDKISDYFDRLLASYRKWVFRKLRAETTLAQATIIKDIKDNYVRPNGLVLSIEEYRPKGEKEDRIEAILQPRYSNRQMWHYKGGNCELLEEELVQKKPAHDDIKDCLSFTVDFAIPPAKSSVNLSNNQDTYFKIGRFGGVC
jgi:hypothetical protein